LFGEDVSGVVSDDLHPVLLLNTATQVPDSVFE
jgi:hypothetical protein